MIDIEIIRSDPDSVRRSMKKRNDKEKLAWFEELLKLDLEWRSLKGSADELRSARNSITEEIKSLKAKGKSIEKKLAEAKALPQKIKESEAGLSELREKIDYYLMRLPNILDDSVPTGKDSSENPVVKKHGVQKKPSFPLRHHGEFAEGLGLADFERAVKISGTGFFILKGQLALMDLALQRLAIEDLVKKGFMLIEPPFLLRRRPYEGVTDLADFENVMYKIEGEDLYLIATSEHPMAAMHMDEILKEEELPLKYCGLSACFRREVGKHGLDERGLFRVHQFSKIEQFIFCRPEDSGKFHEQLLANSEWLLQQLDIPYRVVGVCTGDIGTVAAKKFDVEGYSPREDKFIELMSCSNCTSYQAARLNIRFRKKDNSKGLVHTLNNTEVATSRMLRLILEHYQTVDGTLKVPKALQPHMNGLKEIAPQTAGK